MNLRTLSDSQLLERTEALAREEREVLTKVLHHLREIESRRLFSALGFKSLFDYAVKKLGYSADQAGRRVSAMRLLKEMPELEKKIESGSLNLTNLGLAQSLFRKEKLSPAAKVDLIRRLENTSTREAEKIVIGKSSNPIQLKPDRIRAVSPHQVLIQFTADDSLTRKLDQIKGLLAHTDSGGGLAELINNICDIAIERLSPLKRKPRTVRSPKVAPAQSIPAQATPALPIPSNPPAAPLGHGVKKRKPISAAVRWQVWRRAGERCQNCGSGHALQLDHRIPIAMGGTNELKNLRLLCRPCNQRAAIEHLGLTKMRPYLDRAARV